MKKLITLILSVLLIGTACFGLTACGNNSAYVDDVSYIQNKGKLVVGVTDYDPMDYKDASGNWIGFDADLATDFAKMLGVSVEFIEIDWDSKTTELSSKNIDLIWNGMTADSDLGKTIDFSVSYAKNYQCAVIQKSDAETIKTKEDIKNQTVAVENGSAGNNVATSEGIKTINAVKSQVFALNEVNSKQSKVALIDATLAQSIVGKGDYANLQIVSGVEYASEIFAVGLRKNSNLKSALNVFLKVRYEDGKMSNLVTKYGDCIVLNDEALKA